VDRGALLTPKEVAELFGVDPKTLVRWAAQGRIAPAQWTLGGHRRYAGAEVARLLAEARRRRVRSSGSRGKRKRQGTPNSRRSPS
jgi:excisionase family DNA binding protein